MLIEQCPHCGKIGTIHRSRSRSFKERVIKFFLPYKTYRCSECGWRGWIYIGWRNKIFGLRNQTRKVAKFKIAIFLVVLTALILFVYYNFERIGRNLAPVVKEFLNRE